MLKIIYNLVNFLRKLLFYKSKKLKESNFDRSNEPIEKHPINILRVRPLKYNYPLSKKYKRSLFAKQF